MALRPGVRALIVGPAVGVVIGLLALFGSNSVPAGLVAFVVVSLLYGAIMGRRMAKFWPGAKQLSGADRVAVARATRSGRDIGDARLAAGVIDYSRSLHRAAEGFRLWWWLILVLGVVALGTAIADTIFAPVREAVVSWLYFGASRSRRSGGRAGRLKSWPMPSGRRNRPGAYWHSSQALRRKE